MDGVKTGIVFASALTLSIVVIDVFFLRHNFWWRLIANVAVAATFAVAYWYWSTFHSR
jgi:hypothetical protein